MKRTQVGIGARETAGTAIRQARSDDRDAIRDFLAGLSPRTRRLRFFSCGLPVGEATLRRLAGGGDTVDVVVAAEEGAIIGHAMAVDAAGPGGTHTAEIGVVVADGKRGRGIGSALTRAVTSRAQARGATAVVMDVLAENVRVFTMIARRWPCAHYERSGAFITVRADLPVSMRPGRRIRAARAWPAEPRGHLTTVEVTTQ